MPALSQGVWSQPVNMELANLGTQRQSNKIEKEIQRLARALSRNPVDNPNRPLSLVCLGASYEERFQLLGKQNDLNKAIEYVSVALNSIPEDHPSMPGVLADLATYYFRRFVQSGNMDDLNKAIKDTFRAISLTQEDQPYLPGRLSRLGMFYSHRYDRLNELQDLERALEYQSRALVLWPEGHRILPSQFRSQGLLYGRRFQRVGNLDDLGKAIECTARAIALSPKDNSLLQTELANLGMFYYSRFQRLGKLGDLDEAIKHIKRAVALTSRNHPQSSNQLANLGMLYHHRFQRSGEVDYLNKAIRYTSRAYASVPEGHPQLSRLLASLEVHHSDRYERLGEPGDLEKAIDYGSRSLALITTGDRRLPSQLARLSAAYSQRFQREHRPDDIEKAIQYQSQAVELTPDSHLELSKRLSNLGSCYDLRFQRLSGLNDLEKAIEHTSRALSLTPDGHSDVRDHLVRLGILHGHRFQRLHELNDLQKTTEYNNRALCLTEHDKPELSSKPTSLEISPDDRAGLVSPSDSITSPQVGFQIEPLGGCSAEESSGTAINYEDSMVRDIPISRKMVGDTIEDLRQYSSEMTDYHTKFSEHPIAQGGSSNVYRGYLPNNTRVAIKTLRISVSDITESRKDFKACPTSQLLLHAARELHIWNKCTHPNILRLHGLAEFRGQIGMVSSWMERGNLPSYLEQTPGVDRFNLCARIGDGLAHMHQIGIIHGDLKGANVLISDDGTPVLTDFGNSLYPDQTMKFTETKSGSSLTVRWSAPELIDEISAPSEASDVYALGMTIYEVFAGAFPYVSKREQVIINLVVYKKEPPERPQELSTEKEYGDKIWNLLLCCWSYEPELRPEASSVARTMRAVAPESASNDNPPPTLDP